MLYQGIGQRIRELRLKKGLTAEELGSKAGISQPVISRIERAKHAFGIREEYITKIANTLDVDVEELLGFNEWLPWIPQEIRRFIANENSLPYIKQAFLLAQLDNIKKELPGN